MDAAQLMTKDLVCVDSTENVGTAMALLAELDVRHLPVVDGGSLVGMLSDRDFRDLGLHRLASPDDVARLEQLHKKPVADVMSGAIHSIEPSTALAEIIELMISEKVGALPVVDRHDESLVGIVSYVDVLRVAAARVD